jgi:hypothetical protein
MQQVAALFHIGQNGDKDFGDLKRPEKHFPPKERIGGARLSCPQKQDG